jgi:hypothetical protein
MTYKDNESISFNKESGVIDIESSSESRPNYVTFRWWFSYQILLYNLNDLKNHGMYHFHEKSGVVVHCSLRYFDDPIAMDWFGLEWNSNKQPIDCKDLAKTASA